MINLHPRDVSNGKKKSMRDSRTSVLRVLICAVSALLDRTAPSLSVSLCSLWRVSPSRSIVVSSNAPVTQTSNHSGILKVFFSLFLLMCFTLFNVCLSVLDAQMCTWVCASVRVLRGWPAGTLLHHYLLYSGFSLNLEEAGSPQVPVIKTSVLHSSGTTSVLGFSHRSWRSKLGPSCFQRKPSCLLNHLPSSGLAF